MHGTRVLLVEGDWRMGRFVRANLEVLGMSVDQAANGQQALELSRRQRPAAVLIDLDCLDMDVAHLVHCLRSQWEGLPPPLVLMSDEPLGHRLRDQVQPTLVLHKPFAASRLLEGVKRVLAGPNPP